MKRKNYEKPICEDIFFVSRNVLFESDPSADDGYQDSDWKD